MRLIDADSIKMWKVRSVAYKEKAYADGWNRAVELINQAETVDAAPVVHGRWDNIPNTYMSVISKDRAYHGNATTCSLCHEVNPNAYKTNYCPNCGAKMDLEG